MANDFKICSKCKMEIPKKATKCPHCRSSQGISCSGMLGALAFLLIAGFIISTIGASNSSGNTNTGNSINSSSNSSATLGEINALGSAKLYLSTMPFSYSGLIKQLKYEGYSESEATYAANNCGADWNEQAAKNAKLYLSVMPFSRSELIEQLIYEGYTESQAEYGVSACGY